MNPRYRATAILVVGLCLIISGVGFLAHLAVLTYGARQLVAAFGGTVGPAPWEAWALLTAPVAAVVSGIYFVAKSWRHV